MQLDPLVDYGAEIAQLVAQIAAATSAGRSALAAVLTSELNGRVAALLADPAAPYAASGDTILVRRGSTGGMYELNVAALRLGVADTDLSLTDVITNDVSIARHGFAPKAPNDASKYLNGLGAWAIPGLGAGATRSVSAAATVTTADYAIRADATSAAYNVTLPAAATCTGSVFVVKKTDSSANVVTLATAGGNIEGAATQPLAYQFESLAVQSDGTNYNIVSAYSPRSTMFTDWTDGGAIGITGTTSNPTKGTTTRDKAWYRRVGSDLFVRMEYVQTVAGVAGTGDYLLALPGSFTIDTAKVNAASTVQSIEGFNSVGCGSITDNTNLGTCSVSVYDSTHVRVDNAYSSGAGTGRETWKAGGQFGLNTAAVRMHLFFVVPITGFSQSRW